MMFICFVQVVNYYMATFLYKRVQEVHYDKARNCK